jgi:ribose transport system substrate-binding protein
MPRQAHLLFVSLLLSAAALLPLVGCGSRQKVKYKIAVIPKGLTHEFWKSIERGARRAAADLGEAGIPIEVLWDGPRKESDASDQINIVQTMVSTQRVDGVVLAPQDSKAMVAVVEETVEKGRPVVIIDSGLDKRELMVKYVATNNYNGGKMAAEHLLAVLARQGKPTPKLVLFRYEVGSESTEQREKGFMDHVQSVIGECKKKGRTAPEVIDDREYAGATVDSAQAKAAPLLIRVKDRADGIFAVNESATNGLLNAMRSQELNGKIRLMGFDSSAPLLQAVKEGDVDGLIVQDPYRMGYLGVWTMVRYLEGFDVAPDRSNKNDGKDLSTGEYLVTRDNLEKTSTRELFDPKLQAERTLKLPKYDTKR